MNRTVVKLPDPSLAYTNKIFVNHNDILKNNFVQIGKQVYFSVQHDEMEENCIGLSLMQRESCNLSANDKVDVFLYAGEKNSIDEIVLSVDLFNNKMQEIEVEDIIMKFKESFMRQIFFENCLLAMKINNNFIEIQCVEVKPPGIFNLSTNIKIITKNKNIILKDKRMLDKINWNFEQLGIGGMDEQFKQIFRRAFVSRMVSNDIINKLSIEHVKGILLYGPAGTGKTLISRKIGKLLSKREPKIINGPEILNKYVGQSEENLRKIFQDSIDDWKENKEKSDLHVIIFDEIDAICKTRGSDTYGDKLVNQLLTMIDGVNSPKNFLIIGMTNRKDMIDPALLRPGRLELHIEISLPDLEGREQIFRIHMNEMMKNQLVSPDIDIKKLSSKSKNFSGAEIEGLVKCAASHALCNVIEDEEKLFIEQEHFDLAFDEVKPAFGADEEDLNNLLLEEKYIDIHLDIKEKLNNVIEKFKLSKNNNLNILLEGKNGTGKTTLSAQMIKSFLFPYTKIISPDKFMNVKDIQNIFENSYRSDISMIFMDDIERLIEYIPVGPRFNCNMCQIIMVMLKKNHKNKLIVIGTTSNLNALEELNMDECFDMIVNIPELELDDVNKVLNEFESDVKIDSSISIKKLKLAIENGYVI